MRTGWRPWLLGLVLGWGAAVQAAGPLDAPARAGAVKMLANWAERDFQVPADLTLDAALRTRLEALASQHRERLAALAAAWIDEELPRVDLVANPLQLGRHVLARYVNESVIWQLDSTGEAYDRLMLRDVADAGSCASRAGRQPFGVFAAALQKMAPAERELALAAQQQMLARWGQPRAIPERPSPSLIVQGQDAMARLRAGGGAATEPPVPPVLAYHLLAVPQRAMDAHARCALVRWTLSREAQGPADAASRMTLARYALLADAAVVLRQRGLPELDEEGFPRIASAFDVVGDVTAVGRARPTGSGLDEVRIENRQVSLPGVRGVRAVGFETVFDEATLQRAAKTPTRPGQGEWTELPFTWTLK
ncbi:MAG: hypothetical protein GXC94_00465 [Comamonadaceae bacterium]|jgi:hypothetical protein|nr:hypothetical protein [Comamonadaceae bacterium]